MDRDQCLGEILRVGGGRHGSVNSLLDELRGRVVRPVHDDDGDASSGGLDHDESVALPPGREEKAEGADSGVFEHVCVDEPWRRDVRLEPEVGDRPQHLLSLRTVAVDLAAEVRNLFPRPRQCRQQSR